MSEELDLKTFLLNRFQPVDSLADVDLPLTTLDVEEILLMETGTSIDSFEIVHILKFNGFNTIRVNNQYFWLMK